MTLAQKIEQILKGELKPENIKTIIDLAEFSRIVNCFTMPDRLCCSSEKVA